MEPNNCCQYAGLLVRRSNTALSPPQFLVTPRFAGTPEFSNCYGTSVSALARQFGGLNSAASALNFPSVQALQNAIREFCGG
jgi:hypothetical protein